MTEQKSLRIGVDLRPVLTGQISGVEQYTISVLGELLAIDPHNTYVLFYVSYKNQDRHLLDLLARYPALKSPNVEIRKLKWINWPMLLHGFFKPLNWPKADVICGGLDAMWMPSPMLLPLSSRCARITTFHDLIFFLFPQFYTLKSRIWQWQMDYPYEGRISDAVIAVSKNTKRDLIKLLHTDPGKIQVIYEGVAEAYSKTPDEAVFAHLKNKWHLPDTYIYYVGSIEPRKNLVTVVRALKQLQEEIGDTIKLVVSGGKSWLENELYQTIKELGLERQVIFTGRVEEAEKIALLQHALAFVFPSFYEGFGLMVLEAFAAGCPVITSNVASLPEVAGDAGILVEPTDSHRIAEAIKKLLQDASWRAELIRRGKVLAKPFSWEATARQTLAAIEQAVREHGNQQILLR